MAENLVEWMTVHKVRVSCFRSRLVDLFLDGISKLLARCQHLVEIIPVIILTSKIRINRRLVAVQILQYRKRTFLYLNTDYYEGGQRKFEIVFILSN